MTHPAHHDHEAADSAWAANLELEGELLLPYVTETATRVAELCRGDGFEVRRILDIGSGPSVITCEPARCFASAMVVAVDESSVMLQRTAARAAAASLSDRISTHQANLRDGLHGLNSADLIWAAMVLHHVGDPVAVLRELRGRLNQEGMMVLIEYGEPAQFLLHQQDRDALDVLLDEGHPLGIMRRTDAFLHVSRHVYVAKHAGNQPGS